MGASNAGGMEKSRFSTNISLYLGNDARYRHSYYRMRMGNSTQAFEWYHFSMILSDISPIFEGHDITSNNSKMVQDRAIQSSSSSSSSLFVQIKIHDANKEHMIKPEQDSKVEKKTTMADYNIIVRRTRSIERRHFNDLERSLYVRCKITPLIDAEYLRNGTR